MTLRYRRFLIYIYVPYSMKINTFGTQVRLKTQKRKNVSKLCEVCLIWELWSKKKMAISIPWSRAKTGRHGSNSFVIVIFLMRVPRDESEMPYSSAAIAIESLFSITRAIARCGTNTSQMARCFTFVYIMVKHLKEGVNTWWISHGSIFHINGHLWGDSTCQGWIPSRRTTTADL